ncbi:Sortilin-related receptor (Fragment) [Geodia barretti]|uniref:Sortilin-related receptor n=1 Tax=Geodia barretti TaxID=519541 RepID=A0AA35VXW3_GEOBA
MKCLAPWSALLAVLVLANSLQLCVSTLEAIKGIHRGGPAVAVGPDMATGDGRKLHRPVAEVEKELAMVDICTHLPNFKRSSHTVQPLQLLFAHATQPRLYYTLDEGDTFTITDITDVNINPRTLLYHPDQDGWMMAQDTSSALYLSRNYGDDWTKVDDNVDTYQWGDPRWDANPLRSTTPPTATTTRPERQHSSYSNPPTLHQQFDPSFGAHDAFLVFGPTSLPSGRTPEMNLYVSHLRKAFRLAKIPTPYQPQRYWLSHIDELQGHGESSNTRRDVDGRALNCRPGNTNATLLSEPDLFISRDGGVTWEQTLKGSWGVGVADHGGLLVAAKDYHQTDQSSVLQYSCNEGYSWNTFHFSRSDTDCILGVTVTIERRRAQTCCLNGRDYDREVSIEICQCNEEDFECDYGYERLSLSGLCERDPDVDLPDPCAAGQKNYTASSGYRKIAGDLCQGGQESLLKPFTAPCCGNTTLPPTLPASTTSSSSSSDTRPTSDSTSPSTQAQESVAASGDDAEQRVVEHFTELLKSEEAWTKVYGESVEAFRVTSTVECVGVLSKHPVLTLFEGGEDGEEGVVGETAAERSAHCPPPSLVPRLHCILVTSLSHTNPLLPRQLPLPLPGDDVEEVEEEWVDIVEVDEEGVDVEEVVGWAPFTTSPSSSAKATGLQLCVSTLEAIKGLHRGGPAVAVGPDMATGDGRKLHRPVAEVEKELAMVIFVLTYQTSRGVPTRSNLYRSENYGSTFVNINSRLESSSSVVLSPRFFVSDFNPNLLLFAHATQPRLYYTLDEGDTFTITDITDVNINPRTLLYHPDQDGWMMAKDTSSALYLSRNYGNDWTKVDDSVDSYQWGDPRWDANPLRIYYTTADPDDAALSGNLFYSEPPYTSHQQFDPSFGAHDAFLVFGPYIFAQRTDAGKMNLYIEGVNGTLVANQYVRDSPSQTNAPKRTLITLDNGGYWELLIPPDVDVDGRALNCRPPVCSLHLHMDSSAYARLGVYSTPSAPGLIIAHAVIYGVITEPGHHTTVMSLYGQTTNRQWRVFTIDFRAVFERECRDSDYILWMPWDLRSGTDCILGVTVTIERRRAQTCCLNGRDYDREVSIEICQCNEEDFQCDYGYERLSLSGLCVRDPDVDLPDPCAAGQKNYTASSGDTPSTGPTSDSTSPLTTSSTSPPPPLPPSSDKLSGATLLSFTGPYPLDVRIVLHLLTSSSHSTLFLPALPLPSPSHLTSLPLSSGKKDSPSSDHGAVIGTGVVIAILTMGCVAVIFILVVVAIMYSSLRKRHMRLILAGEGSLQQRFTFHSDRDSSLEPLTDAAQDAEDDDPLIP